jgi:leucyl aminopeptidase
MSLTFAPPQDHSLPLHLVDTDGLAALVERLDSAQRAWVDASGFKAELGAVLMVPGHDGGHGLALVGYGSEAERARGRFGFGGARALLPGSTFHLVTDLEGDALDEAALGWLLAGYHFGRYKDKPAPEAQLIAPAGVDAARLEAIAAGEALTRNLINTPASDMGPDELEEAARGLAEAFDAHVAVTIGEQLLAANFPMIHAVGRASHRSPRLIDLAWGDTGPRLTLVGKGVCFDTGGLNLKPGASMALMKKDMGGAATVLGLARMIMSLGLELQLRVLIPAVENSVSGNAMRPGDILTSRKTLTVEITNTDAEGRLVLADALAYADEETPDLVVSMATLTGAARVAVGTDLAPFYATSPDDADALKAAAARVADPVWEMPFWTPYEAKIEPGIADLDNAPSGGMAGSVTAALFLKRFVTASPRYMHFDIYGWQPDPAPARPKGGVGQGARALLAALPGMLGL